MDVWLGLGWMAAWAAPSWTAEPARPLLDGSFVDLAVGEVGGRTVVLGLGSSSSALWTPDGPFDVAAGGSRAVFLPTGDSGDLVVCGPSGVARFPHTDPPFTSSVPLTTTPCLDVAVLDGTLVVLTDEGALALDGTERSTARMLVPAADPTAMAVTEGRIGVLVDGEVHVRDRGAVRVEAAPSDAVGLAPDGQGWSFTLADESLQASRAPLAVPADDARSVDRRAAELSGDDCPDVVERTAEGLVLHVGRCVRAMPEIPPVPTAIELTPRWTSLTIDVDDVVELQLSSALDADALFYLRGGSPGMTLTPEGRFRFTPTPDDVGLWRTGIQVRTGSDDLWTGIVVRVVGEEPVQPVRDARPPVTPERPQPSPGPWSIRQCLLTVGAHGGLSQNKRTEWSAVGLPDVVASGSPAILAACSGGGERVRWVFGVDTAPAFFTLATNSRAAHLVGGTLGLELGGQAVRAGPIVNAGLLFFGVGARVLVLPFATEREARHGFELRMLVHPDGLAGSAMLGYTVEFGRF